MLIGPQNLAVHVNHVRSRISHAAKAAGRDPGSITLVAVTKAKPAESVRSAATAGVTDFGENYLQEALGKIEELKSLPVRWHFIGGLQSNKTRAVAQHFDWVHSVDRLSVARRLSEQRPFHAPPLNVCIQVALVPEPAKGASHRGSSPNWHKGRPGCRVWRCEVSCACRRPNRHPWQSEPCSPA
jgi:PLP dependent protein